MIQLIFSSSFKVILLMRLLGKVELNETSVFRVKALILSGSNEHIKWVLVPIGDKWLKDKWRAMQNRIEESAARVVWRSKTLDEHLNILLTLTWCHRTPAETPTILCTTAIRVEEDLHSVAPGRDDWRQEVQGMRWI